MAKKYWVHNCRGVLVDKFNDIFTAMAWVNLSSTPYLVSTTFKEKFDGLVLTSFQREYANQAWKRVVDKK